MSSDSTSNSKNQYQVPADFATKAAWLMRVLADPILSSSAKVIATRLMHFHNDKSGRCDPSQATLAKAVGMSRQKVNPKVAELVTRGWIATDGEQGSSLSYRLEVDREQPEAVQIRPTRAQPQSRKVSPASDRGVSPISDRGCPIEVTGGVTRIGQGVSPASDTNHQDNQLENHPKNGPHQPQATQTATVIPLRSSVSGPGPRVLDDRDEQSKPEHIINGVHIPDAEMKQWKALYRRINVDKEVYAYTNWMRDKGIFQKDHLTRLIGALDRKEAEAEKAALDRKAKSEAEAKHLSEQAKRMNRPAI